MGASEITRRAIEVFSRRVSGDTPLFLYLHYNEVHWKYVAPARYYRRFARRGLSVKDTLRLGTEWRGMGNRLVDADAVSFYRDLYDGALAYCDESIGRLLEHLRDCGMLDEMLVIVTADHGENLGEHGLLGHGWLLNDALLRVPLILRYPPLQDRHVRPQVQASLADVAPTILHCAGLERASSRSGFDGASLVPYILGEESKVERYAFAEVWEPNISSFPPMRELSPHLYESGGPYHTTAMRGARYKLIATDGLPPELYDVGSDPVELTNIASAQPHQAALMKERLDQEYGTARAPELDLAQDEVAEIEARLRGLGYL